MVNRELTAINSVLTNKDIGILFGESTDDLFVNYGDVWEWLKKYYSKHRSVPDVSVVQDVFPDFDAVDTKAETAYYVDDLRNEYIQNRLENIMIKAGTELSIGNSPHILDKLQRSLSKLNRMTGGSKDSNIMDFEDAEHHYEAVRERAEAMGGQPGIPTGVKFIDSAYTSGLVGGDLLVVMGYPARGKSLFTTLMSCNAYDLGHKPMIVSLEMSEEKVRDRAWTIMASGAFSNSELSLGRYSESALERFKERHDSGLEFIVTTSHGESEFTPNLLQSKIDQHKPSLVVADYAQLMSDNDRTPDITRRLMNMSRQFKRLAVSNDIPIILISSATPDATTNMDEPPDLENAAWSKAITYDADLAFAVHRHMGTNIFEIVCRKNRNGELFAGYLDWNVNSGIVQEKFDL